MKNTLVFVVVLMIGAAFAENIQIKVNREALVGGRKGPDLSINIGSNHAESYGLFEYLLPVLPSECSITSAELWFPQKAFVSSAGSGQAVLLISKLDGSNWTEGSIALDKRPKTVGPPLGQIVVGDLLNPAFVPAPLDITSAVVSSLEQGRREFGLQAGIPIPNGDIVFLYSKEKADVCASYLNIQYECKNEL
ncbi:galactokinase [Acrasis kona]|uniref:Galactokinase n=1 Tax=Acrasis kona TaxID=1008807 RepID=A0AAW2ZHV9_9EUKA